MSNEVSNGHHSLIVLAGPRLPTVMPVGDRSEMQSMSSEPVCERLLYGHSAPLDGYPAPNKTSEQLGHIKGIAVDSVAGVPASMPRAAAHTHNGKVQVTTSKAPR